MSKEPRICEHCKTDKNEHNFVNDACPIKADGFTVAFSKTKRFQREITNKPMMGFL